MNDCTCGSYNGILTPLDRHIGTFCEWCLKNNSSVLNYISDLKSAFYAGFSISNESVNNEAGNSSSPFPARTDFSVDLASFSDEQQEYMEKCFENYLKHLCKQTGK